MKLRILLLVFPVLVLRAEFSSAEYDLLLRGGHVVDPKNGLNEVKDVAIENGRVAAVSDHIEPASAFKVIDVPGLYVTAGLIDIHTHVFAGTGERNSYAGDNSVYPDGFSFRTGVTTVVDAGGAGWRNFDQFKARIIDRSRTRVLAFLNIVGHGMRGQVFESNLTDMEVEPTLELALRHPDIIVGIKTAHYMGPEFAPVERAVAVGKSANIPVMVDFGRAYTEKSLGELLRLKLRRGDIYTHVYSGIRGELDEWGRPNPALRLGQDRGVFLDVGHGGGSFAWRVAVPIVEQGILPDTISTDFHVGSMNAGMKDMLNVMSKFLALGLTFEQVILRSTWNPARAIQQEHLGNLGVGAPADLAVLRIEEGKFGFLDMFGARHAGTQRLSCEMTIRDGKVVYELNGLSRPDWKGLPGDYRHTGDRRWDGTRRSSRRRREFESDPPATPGKSPLRQGATN